MDGVNMRSTFQRWEAAVAAAEILNTLDNDEQEESDEENGNKIAQTLGDGSDAKNGNSDNLFGKSVDNEAGATGIIDTTEFDKENDQESLEKGLTDCSKGTSYEVVTKDSLIKQATERWENTQYYDQELEKANENWEYATQQIYTDRMELRRSLRYLQQLVEPYAELMSLPEYGLRTGRLSGNALWKVPTQVIDNDRVFHRKHVQGDTQEVSIALMMDYSGSMHGVSIQIQRKMALLLYDLFKDFPIVDFHMFAHETWYTNQVYNMTDIETVYFKSPTGGTNEGTALGRTATEFLALSPKQNRKVILALGDGCSGPADIKKSVKMIRKAGMEVYDILIDGDRAQATECYGAGKVVTVASCYQYKETASVSFQDLNLTEQTDENDLLQAQIIAVVRPWLAQIFSRMHNLGAI
jgi:hypothetical protein